MKNCKAPIVGINLEKNGKEIFGLYRRFHTGQIEGKGMGLYIVKAQVERLGGTISVKSEVDQGTEFTLVFVP
jgi:signal transduction histidine kinase